MSQGSDIILVLLFGLTCIITVLIAATVIVFVLWLLLTPMGRGLAGRGVEQPQGGSFPVATPPALPSPDAEGPWKVSDLPPEVFQHGDFDYAGTLAAEPVENLGGVRVPTAYRVPPVAGTASVMPSSKEGVFVDPKF